MISAGTLLELSIVAAARLGASGPDAVRAVLDRAAVVTMPVDDTQVTAATEAWLRFGKGRHRAALNYGDCYGDALARHCEVPLLCVGDDFRHTDVAIIDVVNPP